MTTRTELNKYKQDEINSEEKKRKSKRLVLLFFKLAFIIMISLTLFFLYIIYVANAKIIVKEERIVSKKIPDNFNGLKIIHFSDIHFGTSISITELKHLVKIINKRNPDIIVFTGDLIDKNYKVKPKELNKIIEQLKSLNANIGKYAVMGDEDNKDLSTVLTQGDFTVLNNQYECIYKGNNPILLVGLNSSINKTININSAYSYFKEENHNSNIYTISIMHEPDSVDEILSQFDTDLFLAGHSHNGQIVIPYIGTLSRKNGAKKYYNSSYKVKNSKLFISSGIGTNGNGIRLFNHPSINFFRLSNK